MQAKRRLRRRDSQFIWAVDDVSFDVNDGDAVAIIGRNGAGKSTLLKLLSRITEPTAGYADIYGRVASLLEVGTGFNAELTGRENIYLNGAILGMNRAEVRRKFDEIVDFSGVGQAHRHAGQVVLVRNVRAARVRGRRTPRAGDPHRRRGARGRRRRVPEALPRPNVRGGKAKGGPSCSSVTTCRRSGVCAGPGSCSSTARSSRRAAEGGDPRLPRDRRQDGRGSPPLGCRQSTRGRAVSGARARTSPTARVARGSSFFSSSPITVTLEFDLAEVKSVVHRRLRSRDLDGVVVFRSYFTDVSEDAGEDSEAGPKRDPLHDPGRAAEQRPIPHQPQGRPPLDQVDRPRRRRGAVRRHSRPWRVALPQRPGSPGRRRADPGVGGGRAGDGSGRDSASPPSVSPHPHSPAPDVGFGDKSRLAGAPAGEAGRLATGGGARGGACAHPARRPRGLPRVRAGAGGRRQPDAPRGDLRSSSGEACASA